MNLQETIRNIVMVVDDSADTLGMLNEVLDKRGHTVLVALEGSQAISIAQSIVPDIILLDAMMPNMDGFETCKEIKKRSQLAHIPVIFMTGLTDTGSIVKGFEAGGVDYVTKPINTEELSARINVHLSNAKQALSARTALDFTGHFLMAVDNKGALVWTTPQAQHLLDQAGVSSVLLKEQLPTLVRKFLSPHFNKNNPQKLDVLPTPLEIRYISQTGSNEYLIRLVDPSKPSETEMLRNAYPLTEREAEVLLWVGNGKTNREIAIILSLSPRTVNKHLEQIYKKLGVENRTTAAGLCIRCLSETANQVNRQSYS